MATAATSADQFQKTPFVKELASNGEFVPRLYGFIKAIKKAEVLMNVFLNQIAKPATKP